MTDKRFLYYDLLKLDSFYNFLTFEERLNLHISILGRSAAHISYKCKSFLSWLAENNWEGPYTRYGQDRLLYYKTPTGQYLLVEDYALKNPVVTKQVLAILKRK